MPRNAVLESEFHPPIPPGVGDIIDQRRRSESADVALDVAVFYFQNSSAMYCFVDWLKHEAIPDDAMKRYLLDVAPDATERAAMLATRRREIREISARCWCAWHEVARKIVEDKFTASKDPLTEDWAAVGRDPDYRYALDAAEKWRQWGKFPEVDA